MIHSVSGRLSFTDEGAVVIETSGGIGYLIHVPGNTSLHGRQPGETVRLYTELIVRDDDVSLYGFTELEALEVFQKLRTVNGIGAKAAMSILSALTVTQIRQAIVFEDIAPLTQANGVGKKTAQRIILELKDRIGLPADETAPISQPDAGGPREEAVAALEGLGYSRSEAMIAVAEADSAASVEDYIKFALRQMSGRR